MSRRLPVYLLIDTSGSMTGEPIEAVKNGLQSMISSLRENPYALETAYLSVITFDSSARQNVPLTEIASFNRPDLRASGTTALGQTLDLVAAKAEEEVVKTTLEKKGDWRPLVFIMTDGEPTEDISAGLARFKNQKWGIVVACAAGPRADIETLKRITDNVVSLDSTDSATFAQFFKWLTASVTTGSQKVEEGGGEPGGLSELPPPPPEVNIIL